jgi:hypothetical protein
LLLKDASGNWHKAIFRVDSGTDMTSMAAAKAKALGLPMPLQGTPVPMTTTAGTVTVTLRAGFLRIMVEGMAPREHVIPCHFLGDHHAPLPGAVTAPLPRSLLGLTGVVDKLRIITDGTPVLPNAPHGNLIVETI